MSTVEKAIRLYAWKTNYQTFRIVQGEVDSRTFNIQLFSTTIPVDLTNCSVMLYAVKPDSTVVYVDCELLDAVNGLVSVTLSEQMAAVEGTVDCWVQVVGEGGTDLRFEGMNLEVGECNLSEKVRSADEMRAFLQKSAELAAVQQEVRNARMGKSSLEEKERSQDTSLSNTAAALRQEMKQADTNLEHLIAVEKARIDALAQLPQGSTSGDAELTDIRVDDEGNIHDSAGAAVRARTGKLREQLVNLEYAIPKERITSGVAAEIPLSDVVISGPGNISNGEIVFNETLETSNTWHLVKYILPFVTQSNAHLFKGKRLKFAVDYEIANMTAGKVASVALAAFAVNDGGAWAADSEMTVTGLPFRTSYTNGNKSGTLVAYISDAGIDTYINHPTCNNVAIFLQAHNAAADKVDITFRNFRFVHSNEVLEAGDVKDIHISQFAISPEKTSFFDKNSHNLLDDVEGWELGYPTGAMSTNILDYWHVSTNVIDISHYGTLDFTLRCQYQSDAGIHIACYDENMKFLWVVSSAASDTLSLAENTRFVRICLQVPFSSDNLVLAPYQTRFISNIPELEAGASGIHRIVDTYGTERFETGYEIFGSSVAGMVLDSGEIGYTWPKEIQHAGILTEYRFISSANFIENIWLRVFRYNEYSKTYETVHVLTSEQMNDHHQMSVLRTNPGYFKHFVDFSNLGIEVQPGDIIGFDNYPRYMVASSGEIVEGVRRIYYDNEYVYLASPGKDIEFAVSFDVVRHSNKPELNDCIGVSVVDDTNVVEYGQDCFVYTKQTVPFNCVLKTLTVHSAEVREATVAVGLVDQRGWFVATTIKSVQLNEGLNNLDMSSMNIAIPAGYCVAINMTASDVYRDIGYRLQINSYGTFKSLSEITVSGFSKTPIFCYTVSKDSESMLVSLAESVSSLQSMSDTSSNDVIVSASGEKYRLGIDANGDFIKIKVHPDKYLAIGNSITWHGIKDDIDWYSPWGMAASRESNDYAHRIASYLRGYKSGLEMTSVNFAAWETSTARASQLSYLDSYLASQPDLITIQLGENASDITTIEKDYKDLVMYIKSRCPSAFIVMIGMVFPSSQKDDAKKAVCTDLNVPFVDLTAFSSATAFRSSIGATIYKPDGTPYQVTHAGVAGHPSDEGMRVIAQETLKAILGNPKIELT